MKADAPLDYEESDSYVVDVAATLNGSSMNTQVTVGVTNLDDEAPTIASAAVPTGVTLARGSGTMLSEPIDIDATDDLGNDISFSFVDGPNLRQTLNGFNIGFLTGIITSNSIAHDAETEIRRLTVRATDQSIGAIGDTTSEIEVAITILPTESFSIASDIGFSIPVVEVMNLPQTTLTTFESWYPDNSPVSDVTYTIEPNPAPDIFGIANGNQLVIAAGATFDYESIQQYTLTIHGAVEEASGSADLTIDIVNRDDAAPQFVPFDQNITIDAGESEFENTIDIDAIDDVGAEISYAFVDDGNDVTPTINGFTIDADTGVITVDAARTFSDTAAENNLMFTIRAIDTSPEAFGETFSDINITITVVRNRFSIATSTISGENIVSARARTDGPRIDLWSIAANYLDGFSHCGGKLCHRRFQCGRTHVYAGKNYGRRRNIIRAGWSGDWR